MRHVEALERRLLRSILLVVFCENKPLDLVDVAFSLREDLAQHVTMLHGVLLLVLLSDIFHWIPGVVHRLNRFSSVANRVQICAPACNTVAHPDRTKSRAEDKPSSPDRVRGEAASEKVAEVNSL